MRKECSVQKVMVGVLAVGLVVIFSGQVFADDTSQLKDQIKALQDRVDQLESQDPFTQMVRMREQMDRNMRQAFADTGVVFNPRMDMKQNDKQYNITMDIPGMDKDKINVEIKDGELTVSGERRSETDNKSNQYYRQERSFGTFMQVIPLPDDAQKDKIEASYKNGVLTVVVAREKKEEKKSESEKIMVK